MIIVILICYFFFYFWKNRTSFYIIGMISKTSTGIEKLEEYGWNSPYLPFGKLNGICVPNHSSQFLNVILTNLFFFFWWINYIKL